MTLTYCEQFGFDADKIQERLKWFGLEQQDHATAQRLQDEVIQPCAAKVIDQFYDWLWGIEDARSLLGDAHTIEHLKVTQAQYLTSLGINFHEGDYFESRLRIGQAHAWVGLSLSLYQCAYHFLSQLILTELDQLAALNPQEAQGLRTFVHKIMALDMSLAIETYHCSQIQTLEDSLQRIRRQESRLRMEAQSDSLTGLSNHEHIVKGLSQSLKLAAKSGEVCGVIMADLDHFKNINDEHGHLVGDKVLVEVARRLNSALRDFDILGRYGGEEFLMVLRGASKTTMPVITERIRHHVANEPINLQGLEVHVTISLGVTYSRPGDHADDAIARADEALYRAKSAGRNRVEYAD
jgi:diguanylate cyclase (GGDEF)-like protein